MKISSRDFVLVRRSLGFLALLAGLGAVVTAAVLDGAAQVQARHRAALAERAELSARLARIGEDEAALRRGAARYRALLAGGLGGEERRLDWVETLTRARENLGIPAIQYDIAPKRRLDPDGPFMVSAMTLSMQLLHEDDLLGLLARLPAEAAAMLRVRSCRIERGTTAGLRAECVVDWITLPERT